MRCIALRLLSPLLVFCDVEFPQRERVPARRCVLWPNQGGKTIINVGLPKIFGGLL